MASVNKVIIVGNLGVNPEIRYMPNGDAVTTISVATTDNWKDKASGEKKENTEWHRITFFGRLAEIANQYLKKGSAVYVEGSLHTNKYVDKHGVEKYSTYIRAQSMQMLGNRSENYSENPNDSSSTSAPRMQAENVQKNSTFDVDDDISF